MVRPYLKNIDYSESLKNMNLTSQEGEKMIFKIESSLTKISSLGGFEPPTFRLTAERASRLRHRDSSLMTILK